MGLQEPPISGWIHALSEQRARRERVLAGWQAGVRTAELSRVARAPELATPEPFQALSEAMAAASEGDKPALRRAGLALAQEYGELAAAAARGRALAAQALASVSVELEVVAL